MIQLYCRPSAIGGKGLFTWHAIRAGEIVLRIQGREVNTDDLSDDIIRAGCFQGIAPGRALVSETGQRSFFSYVNHAEEPNCRVDLEARTMVSLRNIAPHEELTVDYVLEPYDERVRRILNERIQFIRD